MNNKKLRKISFAILITYMFSLVYMPAGLAADTQKCPEQQIMYMVDDVFATKNVKDNSGKTIISAWDLRDSGGKFEGNFYSSFKITDSHNKLPVEMNRKFDKVTKGEFTTLFVFKFLTKMNGVSFSLAENSREAMRIVTKDNKLVLKQPNGAEFILSDCNVNTDYGIKANVNVTNQTLSIYLNGALVAENLPFMNTVSCINNFNINTGNETTGEMFFDTVKIYRGYVLNERFITGINNFPSDWSEVSNGGSTSVVKLESRMPPDIYSLKFDSRGGDAAVKRDIEPQSCNSVFETKMLIPEKTDGAGISVLGGGQNILNIVTNGDSFCYISGNNELVPFYNYTANVWYHIKMQLDLPNNTAKIYLNGKLRADNVPLTGIATADAVKAQVKQSDKGVVMMDDFLAYSFEEESADYVPTPVVAQTPNHLLGMQICSMWREGDHRGWDWINPWPDRVPYLGFYDEGSPEVADWEIKWMLEHGIGFQMYCWYRNLAVNEAPIKDSALNYALHDGYFNAKYSDQLPFMILWENASYSIDSVTDFENHLIPFWLEYYFKDDRYLKVDNRPVFGIYYYDRLKTAFGGKEGLKDALDLLTNKCLEAGLGEPYYFISNGGSNPELFKEMKEVGFDAIYNYTWGMASANINVQKMNTEKQANTKEIDVIPSLSMGRDDTAWGLMPGAWTTTKTFTELLEWSRDDFLPKFPNKSLGQDMVIFTTWNEFGEGHFMMPSGLNGFGYMDAVRNVYSGESPHEDLVPTQAQQERFNNLYLPERKITLSKAMQRTTIPKDIKKGWYFDKDDDSEGWVNLQNIKEFAVKGGALSGTVLNNDSSIVSANNLNIDISDVTYIKIRMKNNGESQAGELFFVTNEDNQWNEAKKLDFSTSPFDKEYNDYYLAMWTRSNWKGNLKQFRVDPVTAETGSFEIDSIEFLYDNAEVEGVKLMIDSRVQPCEPEPILVSNRTLVPIRSISEALGARLDWDSWSETVSVMKNDIFLQLKIGENTATKNNKTIELDQGAILKDGRTFVPLRFIAESLGVEVDWDEDEKIVYIITQSQQSSSGSSTAPVMKREMIFNTEFNKDGDFEGWLSNEYWAGATIEKGVFKANSLGNDPILISDTIGVNTKDVKNISVAFKNGTIDDVARMYFITDEDTTWDEDKSILFNIKIKDSAVTQYNFNPNNNPKWKGKVGRLRFDITANEGEVVVDYIRLEGDYKAVVEAPVKAEASVSDIIETERRISWEFDTNGTLNGWVPNKHMGDFRLSNGKLLSTYVGPNPAMQTISDLGIEASGIKSISIKYRNLSQSNKAKLYFITSEDGVWSQEKCFEFEPIEDDHIGEKYIIETSGNPLWKGTLKGLRFEPAYGGGGVNIDYIRLEKAE